MSKSALLSSFSHLFLALAALSLSACGNDQVTLAVILRTDFVPGVEFARVDTVLLEAGDPGSAERILDQKRLMVGRQSDFGHGTQIAIFDDLDPREVVVLTQLIDSRGSIMMERRTRLQMADDFGLSVIMTRDCRGVMCPSPGGQPLFAACVAGTCVDERCQPGAPSFCPEFVCNPSTDDASACPAPADCAEAQCANGICLFPPRDPSTCTDEEWCNPSEGCESLSEMPIEMDAGVDADVDADLPDGMVDDMDDAAMLDDMSMMLDMSMMDDASSDDADVIDAFMTPDLGPPDAGSIDMGITCTGSTVLCDDSCVDLQTNANHCGDCGVDCTVLPHVDGSSIRCVTGICQVDSACTPPFTHCTSDPLDGCEADLSLPASCGSCTTSCSGSTPLCTSDESGDYSCASGCSASAPTLCGATCVNLDNNASACGACGNVCPTSDHGRALCTSRSCSIVCDVGYHLCGGVCVSNYEVTSCGGRCSTCSDVDNGNATCDGTSCGFSCDAGFHACGSLCVDNTSLSSCGSSCTTCPGAPAFGMATCDGFVCDFVCLAGYHRCGSSCVRDDSVSGCGAACITCSAPPSNGTAACVSGSCTASCNTGYHFCGGSCMSDTSPTHCGASCMACPSPSGGSATCSAGVCGTSCPAGTHLCGTSCLSNSSVTSCGTSSCTACPVPTNGSATCNGTACGFTCDPGFVVVGAGCDLPAPRPVWPITSHVVSSHTPTFRWSLSGTTTGAEIQLCNDRACTSVISTTNVTGSSFTPSTPLPARSIVYWRLRARLSGMTGIAYSATWQLATGALSAPVSSSLGHALRDVNGDGYSDIVIGAPTIGRAYVFHGHAGAAPSVTPDATLMPIVAGGLFGGDVNTCDVNSDGYADVLVSQRTYSSNNGRVYVYYGSASGTSTTIGTTIEAPSGLVGRYFGQLVECAGDMNGDGYSDVVITAIVPDTVVTPTTYFFAGSASGLSNTPIKSAAYYNPLYGSRMLFAGDFNGDGYSDVMATHDTYRAYAFFGGASWLSALPPQTGGTVSYGSAAVGDHNGDGYSDIAVLNAYESGKMIKTNRGSASGITPNVDVFEMPFFPDIFAYPPRYLSMDSDNDGYDELLISDPQTPEGRVYIYRGNAGLLMTPAFQTIYNPTFTGQMGVQMAHAGDVDGDGRSDLIVGTVSGEVAYLFVGQASGMFPASPSATLTSPVMMTANFGYSAR